MLSKFTLYGFIVQCLFYSVLLANSLEAQPHERASVYEIEMKLKLDNEKLYNAFQKIEKQTGLRFFYDKKKINLDARVSNHKTKQSLADLLIEISRQTQLKFRRVNNDITVATKTEKDEPTLLFDKEVRGQVTDENGEPLPGANLVAKGTSIGTVTDINGQYKISVPDEVNTLIFSFIGYLSQEVAINDRSVINIELQPDVAALEEVVVVGFGTQKKESVVGSISAVNPSELKVPSSNLTTALAGRVPGMISYQTSGEPGADNAQFFVRGVASFNGQNGPLILIDGIELTATDLARMNPDDIASFSVLKDPTTTAIYGARGANGIILVTTKKGMDGPAKVSLRIENSVSQPTRMVELADPVTHMRLQNEANRTRGDFSTFTEEKIAGTMKGGNPNIYPATDWYDELFRDYANTIRTNLSVRGGGKNVRYYVAGSYNKDNGLLKIDDSNNFSNGINLNSFSFRSNVDIDLTQNTQMILRFHSTLDNYRGPLQGGNAIYNAAVRTSPVRFPAVYEADPSLEGVPHILFGNGLPPRGEGGGGDEGTRPVWFNPYAELQRGYSDSRRQLSLLTLEFKQNLEKITPGLSARFLGNANTTSFFENRRGYSPYFYRLSTFDPFTEEYQLIRTAQGSGDESLELLGGNRTNNSVLYMEAALNYNRVFGEKHDVGGLLVLITRDYLDGNANTVQLSLPSRNIGLSGRFNYGYDQRYFAEFDFGYNGSERFAKNNRFGFFPSFGLSWMVSNEGFYDKLNSTINKLKLRASFGWVGNDKIGNNNQDRFFYLSEVDLSSGQNGAVFGRELNEFIPGVIIRRYANPLVSWEESRKANIGMDINMYDDAIQFRVDAFHEKRTSILQERADIPSTLGLQAPLKTNVGEVIAKGIDASVDINHYFSNDFWVTGRGTLLYSDNEFLVYEEPNYAAVDAPWRSNVGNNVTVAQGYIAERLFVDDEEALNSPVQFGQPGIDYGGGDIKYKDLNGDGVITSLDQAPIGNPQVPKITYGMGISMGYKKLDINVFFQGLSDVSFFMNPYTTGPFLNSIQEAGINAISEGNGLLSENGLLQAYADSHWSEENRDIYALWPRLSTEVIDNNVRRSTWWMRDGSFLRLKQVEIGYSFLDNVDNRFGLSSMRLYVTGTNLFSWSKFNLWDPELGGNGLNYPIQRVINVGLHVGF